MRRLRRRLDTELVARGLAENRNQARRAIEEGRVVVAGVTRPKAATLVAATQVLEVRDGVGEEWVGRGGTKLDAALDRLGIDVTAASALDVGASTGGFTDVLLRRGASTVVALDVGYGQLAWRLREDPRVDVRDRTNFRYVDPEAIGAPFDVIVVDVSFIGVPVLAEKLADCARPGTVCLILVKPQFEVGRERVGKGGIVHDPAAHREAIAGVASALARVGFGVHAVTPSPITGAKGNTEFFLHATLGSDGVSVEDLLRGLPT